jgi:valyl-tRNA synthetase
MAEKTSNQDMAKAYDPSRVEKPLYQMWLDGGYFKPRIEPSRDPFCIIMPPPNVTGELHLGHALEDAITDCLIRWRRMSGDAALWLPGVDHAGIATQNVVEKEIAKEGLTRQDLGREQFVERVWAWVRKYRSVISHQHMRLGASCDWDREVFTMDEVSQRAVRVTFRNLYKDGLIYRGERIINWCPRCQTALSDLEVEHEETDGYLWYVRYPLIEEEGRGKKEDEERQSPGAPSSSEFIVMPTTRPETIVADVAVAVNPTVERWGGVVGRTALLPIIERRIPIIADEQVEADFGTGALKITPGHDPVDFEIAQRHGLPAIVAIAGDGRMNAEAGPYEGLDRFEARERIVADLGRVGLIEKVEPHRYSLGHCERCGTIVEPLVSKQWFVKMEPLANPAIEAVKDGRIDIIPPRFERVYMHWMENIRDWCISRQLWWGHRIPVWHCGDCEAEVVTASDDVMRDPARCDKCGGGNLAQDSDVLDTWFSSGLWSHSTLGWPEKTEELRVFYPSQVMQMGYDILFFWAVRMITLGLYNTGEVPFRRLYLHGLIRDAQNRKMTKSVGNVVDPLELAEKYGVDALRFTLATGGATGNDFRLSDERLEAGRNFANKVWNAARFVIGSVGVEGGRRKEEGVDVPLEDRWIWSRFAATARDVNRLLGELQINEAGRLLYDFFWDEYCDWYLEMAKVRLKAGDGSPLPVLVQVLESSMRLLHPFMPFVTEAVWQHLRSAVEGLEPESIMVAEFLAGDGQRDAEAEDRMRTVIEVVRAIRNIRADRGVDPGRYVEAYISSDGAMPTLVAARPMLEALARVRPLHLVSAASETPRTAVASAVLSRAQVVLPLAGLIDLEAERGRLSAQLAEAEGEVRRLEGKLANEQFRSKAPQEVVRREEEKLASARSREEGLRGRLAELG